MSIFTLKQIDQMMDFGRNSSEFGVKRIYQMMDLRINSSDSGVVSDPVINDLVFLLVIITLTLLTIGIFCTIYRINANEQPNIERFEMSAENSHRIAVPHNSPND